MVTYTQAFPEDVALVATKWFQMAGSFNFTVPAGARACRATAVGCGGLGDQWGGGGALARSVFPVTAGENLLIQVGDTSTAGPPGDSFVKRNDGTPLVYADRGRGNGAAGLASNSIGDVRRDGAAGAANVGGAPASDLGDPTSLGFGGIGAQGSVLRAADAGGGGFNVYVTYDSDGTFLGFVPYIAGLGQVALEFFDSTPPA